MDEPSFEVGMLENGTNHLENHMTASSTTFIRHDSSSPTTFRMANSNTSTFRLAPDASPTVGGNNHKNASTQVTTPTTGVTTSNHNGGGGWKVFIKTWSLESEKQALNDHSGDEWVVKATTTSTSTSTTTSHKKNKKRKNGAKNGKAGKSKTPTTSNNTLLVPMSTVHLLRGRGKGGNGGFVEGANIREGDLCDNRDIFFDVPLPPTPQEPDILSSHVPPTPIPVPVVTRTKSPPPCGCDRSHWGLRSGVDERSRSKSPSPTSGSKIECRGDQVTVARVEL